METFSKNCIMICAFLEVSFGQSQFHGYFSFIGFVNYPSPESLESDPMIVNSQLKCSAMCFADDDCYFFDFCKTGNATLCYFHNKNDTIMSLLENGECQRYGLKQSCDIEYTSPCRCPSNVGAERCKYKYGNYYIHEIVKTGDYELRVDLQDLAGDWAYAGYRSFLIGGASNSYMLKVSDYYGNAVTGDSLAYHNGMKFTTYDRDNDNSTGNCGDSLRGAWRYKDCLLSNLMNHLNGPYGGGGGGVWGGLVRKSYYMIQTKMMVRKKIQNQL